MSAVAHNERVWREVPTRPVIEMPGLQVVPTPAPARGFFGAVLICLLLVIASSGVAFHLNTRMVQGAYELKNIRLELNEVSAREATLTKDVIATSVPDRLKNEAEALGLVPSHVALHVDVATGVITAPAAKK